jgi:hypothetical protein
MARSIYAILALIEPLTGVDILNKQGAQNQTSSGFRSV